MNCYLTREYAENGISFDLLEPMGHGRHIADAFGLPWYVLSAKATKLNPQDVMFPTLLEQVSHTTRLYETVLGAAAFRRAAREPGTRAARRGAGDALSRFP